MMNAVSAMPCLSLLLSAFTHRLNPVSIMICSISESSARGSGCLISARTVHDWQYKLVEYCPDLTRISLSVSGTQVWMGLRSSLGELLVTAENLVE
eukprot:5898721-Amphidinium_carterae.1